MAKAAENVAKARTDAEAKELEYANEVKIERENSNVEILKVREETTKEVRAAREQTRTLIKTENKRVEDAKAVKAKELQEINKRIETAKKELEELERKKKEAGGGK